MSTLVRARLRFRHLVALVIGTGFLVGAAAIMGAYVNRFGFDGSVAIGFAVVVADAWLLARATSGSPPSRQSVVRILARSVAAILLLVGPLLLMVLAYAPIFLGAPSTSPDRALLAVAGVLLVPVIACAGAVVGRRAVKGG